MELKINNDQDKTSLIEGIENNVHMEEEEENSNKSDEKSIDSDSNENQEDELIDILKRKSFHPWITPKSKCHTSHGILKLHYEILDFYEFIKLKPEEKELRKKTFEEVKNLIESKYKEYSVHIFGSFTIDLSLPDSDIDLLILSDKIKKNFEECTKKEKIEPLEKIYKLIEDSNKFSSYEIIRDAKVPIIKCVYKETDIHVDISDIRTNGLDVIKEIKEVQKIFPCVNPLIILIKYALRQRDLNEIYKGGISSFIIFSLVYYFISHMSKIYKYKKKNGEKVRSYTLGDLFLEFLNFYGKQFNYKELGISIRYGGYLYKRKDSGKYVLSMENFQDINQDIGSSCFRFAEVVDFFKYALKSMYFPKTPVVESYLECFINPDNLIKERATKYTN